MAKPQHYVVEHGARGHLGSASVMQWRDSNATFVPHFIKGHDPTYETTAQALCTICGTTFHYKGLKPRMSRPLLWLGVILSTLLCVILARLSPWAAAGATLLEGVFVLLVLVAMFKPRAPYLRQVSGPTRFAHRVRRYP